VRGGTSKIRGWKESDNSRRCNTNDAWHRQHAPGRSRSALVRPSVRPSKQNKKPRRAALQGCITSTTASRARPLCSTTTCSPAQSTSEAAASLFFQFIARHISYLVPPSAFIADHFSGPVEQSLHVCAYVSGLNCRRKWL